MAAAVAALRALQGPLLVVGSGDLLFASGPALASEGRSREALDAQATLKADALASFIRQLGLDVLRPGSSDLARAGSRLRDTLRSGKPRMMGTGTVPEGVEFERLHLLSAGKYRVAFLSDAPHNVTSAASQLSGVDLRVALEHGPESAQGRSNIEHADIVVRSGLRDLAGFEAAPN